MPGPGPIDDPIALWRTSYELAITAAPLVVDGQVVIAGHDGVVRALDIDSGDELWQSTLPAGVTSTGTIEGRTIHVIDTGGVLRTISLDTHEQGWTSPGFLPNSLVTVATDRIIVGAAEGAVALARTDGGVVWSSSTDASRRIALGDGLVYTSGDGSGLLSVLDLDGNEQWTFQTNGADVLTPAVAGQDVYVVARDVPGGRNVVLAIDSDGAETWRWLPPGRERIHGHAVTDERVFVSTEKSDAAVYALDRGTGERLWARPFDDWLISFPTVAEGVVYVAGIDEGIAALDAATGATLWHADIGMPIEAAITVTGGLLLVATTHANGAGAVTAFAAPGDPRVPVGSTPAPAPAARSPHSSVAGPAPVTIVSVDQVEGDSLLLSTAIAPDGTMYVGDMANSRIVVRHTDGSIEMWGERGSRPGQFNFAEVTQNDGSVGVAVSPDGQLIAVGDSGNHRVQLFDADRSFQASFGRLGRGAGQFVNPCCLTIDSDQRVWVVDTAREDVQVFDEAGQLILAFGESGSGNGQLRRPGGAFVDEASNEVLIADFGNRRIAVFSTDGAWLRNYVDRPADGFILGEVNDVAVDRFGRIFAVDTPGNSLFIVDRDGGLLAQIPPNYPGLGQVEFATFELDDEGRLYFADLLAGQLVVAQLGPPIWPAVSAPPSTPPD
jgi:outer membrane protein assembly factor BamB